jgi:hypothetical protein
VGYSVSRTKGSLASEQRWTVNEIKEAKEALLVTDGHLRARSTFIDAEVLTKSCQGGMYGHNNTLVTVLEVAR